MSNQETKAGFIMGLSVGVAVISVIGFFVMFGLYANKNPKDSIVAGANTAPTVAAPVAAPAPTPPAPTPTAAPQVAADDHSVGPDNAKVTLVEFSDIQCPFCQRFHPTVKQIIQEYPNDVKWVYKHFPLDSIHPNARPAAEASECVAEQKGDEGFFSYLDALFANQSLLGRDLYISEAKKLGVNEQQFTNCLDTRKYQQRVEDDYQQGIASGVRGTPSSFVNNQNIPGALPYEQVKAVVDSEF